TRIVLDHGIADAHGGPLREAVVVADVVLLGAVVGRAQAIGSVGRDDDRAGAVGRAERRCPWRADDGRPCRNDGRLLRTLDVFRHGVRSADRALADRNGKRHAVLLELAVARGYAVLVLFVRQADVD